MSDEDDNFWGVDEKSVIREMKGELTFLTFLHYTLHVYLQGHTRKLEKPTMDERAIMIDEARRTDSFWNQISLQVQIVSCWRRIEPKVWNNQKHKGPLTLRKGEYTSTRTGSRKWSLETFL